MNILLIHPYITVTTRETVLTEPIGLMSLASYLEEIYKDKIKVNILDLYALGDDNLKEKDDMYVFGLNDKKEIEEQLRIFSPDLIGIHCNFTGFCQDSYQLAAIVKSLCPGIPVILGGAHATMEAEKILEEHLCIDYVVCGEGELTLKELTDIFIQERGQDVSGITGLCYRNSDGTIIRNQDRQLIADIDSLPFPSRKFINTDFYMRMNAKSLPFTKREPLGILMTSRGCPFNCIFCSTKIMWKRHWRALSAERVIQDIEHLIKTEGVREIVIYDDQFIINKKRVHKICDYLIVKKLGITLSLPAGTSVWLIDETLLKKMKKAGFYRLCFPIETGNLNSIKFIRKKINLSEILEKIKIANRLGFWTQGNFILGFPYETRKEIEETIKYAYNCGLDYVFFYIAKPFAGSEMYDIYKKEGLIQGIPHSSQIFVSDCDTKTLKADELNEIYAQAVNGYLPYKLKWYMNPRNFFNSLLVKLRSLDDIRYAMKILDLLVIRKIYNKFKTALSGSNAKL
ncbi:MAG: radical SAM protein [Pseudomonadota bacterium]